MVTIEYGQQNKEIIILLHGGGLSWWNYKEEAALLQNRYHVILPILDGHADSDRDFISIKDNADELISYIDKNFNGSVLLIGGLSLGGQILVEMLSKRKNICKYAIIESALVIPMKLTYTLIKPTLGLCYSLIKKPWFSKIQFSSLKINNEFYDDYYKDTCKISKENLISFLRANSNYKIKSSLCDVEAKVCVVVGGKEQKKIINSAKMLNNYIKNSNIIIIKGYFHGDISLNHADKYISIINELIN